MTNLKAEISPKRLFFGNEYIYIIYNFITTSDCVILHTVSNYKIRFLHKLSRLILLYKNVLFLFVLYPLVEKYSY